LIIMNKKILLVISLCLLVFCQAFAQNRTITGTVTSKDDGTPIPGVTVKVKGTETGTQTNSAGKYTIVASSGAVLEFSFIGYLPVQLTVQGSDVLNISLATATSQLNEVVVTANDIKREKRTLGYSAPIVDNKQLTEGGNPSALTSLTGLVAGVNITSTANTPGSSTRIVLRGGSSITGNNQALLVVDGVPIDNSSIIGGSSSLNAVDFGNRGNDIDPNDIASITVLKGPAAAALYGSRASNGALMITTKSGANRAKKLEITLNSTNTFSSVLKLPTFQNEYGQGYMSGSATSAGYVTGINDAADNFSWGAPFTGQVEPWGQDINGVTQQKPYSALPNNIRDFFKTGYAADNSLGISSGDDKNSFYLGITSLNSAGVFPTSDTYDKYGIRFNGKATLANHFTATINFNYNKIQQNTPSGGQGSNGIMQNLMQTPRDIPINTMSNLDNPYNGYNTATGTYGFYGAYALNPYYILDNFSNLDDVNRITGAVTWLISLLTG
jgi:TonB-dependent SusC/RagA subfamily outer membrane receptor